MTNTIDFEQIEKHLNTKNVYTGIFDNLQSTDKSISKDEYTLHIELSYMYTFPENEDTNGLQFLNLFNLHVPENMRKQGIATQMIEICERIAKLRNTCGLYVGPCVTDLSEYLIRICEKRGYSLCMPFGQVKINYTHCLHDGMVTNLFDKQTIELEKKLIYRVNDIMKHNTQHQYQHRK